MRVVWLAWYICGVCFRLARRRPPSADTTWTSSIWGVVLPAAFGGVALLWGGAAVGLGRSPPTHRAHQSKPLWAGLVAVAVTVMLVAGRSGEVVAPNQSG